MLCSTLSRFQGAICGSLIPESMGLTNSDGLVSDLIIFSTKSLIESGKLDLANLQPTTSEIALACLPLILFYHDSPQLLRSKLGKIVVKLNQTSQTHQELLIFGKVLALALREKLQPHNFFQQLLSERPETELEQQLELIHASLEQNNSLQQMLRKLSKRKQPEQTLLAIAISCFVFSPFDFASAIKRASLTTYKPQITTALTGALLGIYDSYQNIPVHYRLSLRQHPHLYITPNLVYQLYTSWCGSTNPNSFLSHLTIATATMVQPRTQLKIISQQDFW